MTRAHGRRCEPCEAIKGPLGAKEVKALAAQLKGWRVMGGRTLRQDLVMKDFMSAVRLIDAIARVAEVEGHHPDLHLTGYKNLAIELSTHSVGGLSINDFILAEKITRIQDREVRPVRHGRAAAV
jgi:4a-hydroxytetrahydrobiopterin dehydratase